MKFVWFMAGFFALTALGLQADDWTTTDGTVYRNVTVLSHNDGFVTVMYADGGARIELAKLNPDLQKQFGYDPAKAQAFVAATTAQEKKDRQAQLQRQYSAAPATPSPAPNPVSTASPAAPAPAPVPPVSAAPTTVVAVPPPSKTKPVKPPVDTFAIQQQIHDDQEKLDSLQDDIHSAEHHVRDDYAWYNGYGYHYDNTGTAHPNVVGESPRDVLERLQKKQAALEAEIADLQGQLKLAGQ